MEIKGKKINFIGDSITFGSGASCTEKCYVSLVASKYGAITRNYGIGGTRIARQCPKEGVPVYEIDDKDFCARYNDMEDADIIAVLGGVNDYGHGTAPMGTPEDRTPDTFYGACHYLFRGLIEKYLGKTIFIMTPLQCEWEANPAPHKDGNHPLVEFIDIIKEVARFYSLPVLDLYAESGICPKIPAVKEKYMPDGLHPSDAGYEIVADKVAAFIKTL